MKNYNFLYALLMLLFAAVTGYLVADYVRYDTDREEQSLELGREAGRRIADELDATLQTVRERAHDYAIEVGAIDEADELLASIRQESGWFDLVLGVTVAYARDAFPGKELYSPFFNKALDEFQFVEQTYDYTAADNEAARWFTAIAASGEPRWSEPYYAEAAQSMLVDYGVPLFDEQGRVRAVVDYAITLRDLTDIVDAISVGESGYGFIFEQDNGAILSHPNPVYFLQSVYQLRDGKDEATLERLRNDAEGVVAYNSTYTYKYSWFFFRELASTGWKSVLVFAEDDLLGASDEVRKKIIDIVLGGSLFLIALLAFLFQIHRAGFPRLWWAAGAVTLIVVGNIVTIWSLNLNTDFSRFDDNTERVVNRTILDKYTDQFDDELYRVTNQRYRKVPTGVFIESYETTAFEAKLIGKLWMKYPKALYAEAPPAFYLPDVSALETRGLSTELISEVDYDDHLLVTWRFRATLEQSFSYQQYPFEQNDIRVNVIYPDPSKNILLVPDLSSYDILNPSVKPGINPEVETPSTQTIASFFTFRTTDYKTRFGNAASVQNHPALSFTMATKRIYLSPFIANIVPILIVALILFIVLYISFDRHGDDKAGLTTMNVIQSSAGFLFILLLAHVNERARIETPEIAYIELFYFSMYLFITLQTVLLAMLFGGVQARMFAHADGRMLTVLFWPVLLSVWFALTLLRFY